MPQADNEGLFNQAVQAYQQNQFTAARQGFQRVTGAHTQDAQQYIRKIDKYLEAWSAAAGVLERSRDERDQKSLDYAIERLQEAISIKPDGPGHPQQELEKARQQKAEVQRNSQNLDRGLCDKAVAAAAAHHYQEAQGLSCALSDDNPAFSCGGNEAAYLCSQDTELAKMEKGDGRLPTAEPEKPAYSADTHPAAKRPADLDRARAAYESNNFERASALLKRISGDFKPDADELLDKIDRYEASLAKGEKLSRDGVYEDARAAFLSAAKIKPDGPSNPQSRASAMELFLGVDRFYSGEYASAIEHLQACANGNSEKQALIHFYLGASKLGRFFVTGEKDDALRQAALSDLRSAKQAGFKADLQEVSPKIVEVYNKLF